MYTFFFTYATCARYYLQKKLYLRHMKQLCLPLLAILLCVGCATTPRESHWQYATLAPDLDEAATPRYHSILCGSTVHAALLLELGARTSVAGLCDGQYAVDSTLRQAALPDFGSSLSPDGERILASGVDALWISPVEGIDQSGFNQLGVPIVACSDYLEPTPLARAEWMRYYGRLVGEAERADSLFQAVEAAYLAACDESHTPMQVLTDLPTAGKWYIPGSQSYLTRLYSDAGYTLPCSEAAADATGSVCLSIEQVLAHAAEAEVWFIKYAAPEDLTYEQLARTYPFVEQIRAFREHRIYGCNTLHVPYYEQVPFHPERLLADLTRHTHHYFSPLH